MGTKDKGRGGRRSRRRTEPRGDEVQQFETVSAAAVVASELVTVPEQTQVPAVTHERVPAVWEHITGTVTPPRSVHRLPVQGGHLWVIEMESSSTSCFVPDPQERSVVVLQGSTATVVGPEGVRQIDTARVPELEPDEDLPVLELDSDEPGLHEISVDDAPVLPPADTPAPAPQTRQAPEPIRVGAPFPRTETRIVHCEAPEVETTGLDVPEPGRRGRARPTEADTADVPEPRVTRAERKTRQRRAEAAAAAEVAEPAALRRDPDKREDFERMLKKRLGLCPWRKDGWYALTKILGPQRPAHRPVHKVLGLSESEAPGLVRPAAKAFERLGYTVEDGRVHAPEKKRKRPGRRRR